MRPMTMMPGEARAERLSLSRTPQHTAPTSASQLSRPLMASEMLTETLSLSLSHAQASHHLSPSPKRGPCTWQKRPLYVAKEASHSLSPSPKIRVPNDEGGTSRSAQEMLDESVAGLLDNATIAGTGRPPGSGNPPPFPSPPPPSLLS